MHRKGFIAEIDGTNTELVWPGKFNEDGTRKEVLQGSLPFQVIGTINTSRATRETEKKRQLIGISKSQFKQILEGNT